MKEVIVRCYAGDDVDVESLWSAARDMASVVGGNLIEIGYPALTADECVIDGSPRVKCARVGDGGCVKEGCAALLVRSDRLSARLAASATLRARGE